VAFHTIGTPFWWAAFGVLVAGMLVLDLGIFNRRAHAVTFREAGIWSAVWIALSLIFAGVVWFNFGSRPALEFTTGYVIEKALSVDNLFVFLVVFRAFRVPAAFQHRVLFWGIIGAVVLRAVFIFAGAALLARVEWILYVFGAFLIATGVKLLLHHGETEVDTKSNIGIRAVKRIFPTTTELHGKRFFTRENGRIMATPLLLALVTVELSDVVFAVDSIPAIFGVTTDPFLVYTSNIFAILGLRSLYFLLSGMVERWRYLGHGLAIILMFIGAKMLAAPWVHVPIAVSLGVIAGILLASGLFSARAARRERRDAAGSSAA
jgi:tellurite resistance protein TerC